MISKQQMIEFFLKRDLLLSPQFPTQEDESRIIQMAELAQTDALVVDEHTETLLEHPHEINWKELEKFRALFEKNKNPQLYQMFIASLTKRELSTTPQSTQIVSSHTAKPKKHTPKEFVELFNAKYDALARLLKNRSELSHAVSISRIAHKKEREPVSLIAMVREKQTLRNGSILLLLEDPTGVARAIAGRNNLKLFQEANNTVPDEVIGVTGTSGPFLFLQSILRPGLQSSELRKAGEEAYAAFISDLHVGSKKFLKEEFEQFLSWANRKTGRYGDKEMAYKLKYIFITGDVVDGVGIYPEQESELQIRDIREQYAECARLLSRIPEDITIVLSPGNHDAVRISEPQPPLRNDVAGPLLELPNLISVSNPAIVNIHAHDSFPGFTVLMYHGYSFDYYAANVPAIREKGGYDRPDLIMQFLLERRHLAPAYTSTLCIPDSQDRLVVEKVPDFFATGHVHRVSAVENYKGVSLISGSCWQGKTSFQERTGHNPDPARAVIANLMTRELTILNFTS